MGQKVNPIGIRVGINRTWDSRWFDDRNYADKLVQDLELRKYVQTKLKAAGISKVVIERAAKNTRVTVYTARPGVIIGKKGADIETLRKELSSRAGNDVALNIVEIRKPDIDAQLVAEGVCQQLERRVSFRRAMKRRYKMHCVWGLLVFVSMFLVAWVVLILRGLSGIVKVVCRFILYGRIWITVLLKP